MCMELPRLAKDINVVLFESFNYRSVTSSELRVRRSHVEFWLIYLKTHSKVPAYRNMSISYQNLYNLPVDGVPSDLPRIGNNIDDDENLSQHLSSQLSISQQTSSQNLNQPKNETVLLKLISKLKLIANDHDILSEFNNQYLATLAFPTLFINGDGDPWILNEHSDTVSAISKIRHLLKYSEIVNGKIECRFAEHDRFVLWIYNVYYRHRTLSQAEIYMKKNPSDANMSLREIQQIIDENNNCNPVLNRIRYFMAGIPGSPSYWLSEYNDLKAIIDSKGRPHIFFTFTFADR